MEEFQRARDEWHAGAQGDEACFCGTGKVSQRRVGHGRIDRTYAHIATRAMTHDKSLLSRGTMLEYRRMTLQSNALVARVSTGTYSAGRV